MAHNAAITNTGAQTMRNSN